MRRITFLSILILPQLLLSNIEIVDNSCGTPYPISQLNGISEDINYSEYYSNKHSKEIYLSFNTAVDGNFSIELLKDNDKKMKYQLFIGNSCDNLNLVSKPDFDYTHNINLAITQNRDYIIKVVKHSNGKSKYNISYNFIALQTLTLEDFLQKISNGEKVAPNIVVSTLKAYYAQFDSNVNIAITLKLTPVLHLLNNNYEYYKNIILDMYTDKTNHQLLRLPMLEIIGYHLDDTSSIDAIKTVFDDKSDDSLVVGKSAKLLAQKGIDISQEVESRYPSSDGIAKLYYASVLAFFKPSGSREMIERDMDSEIDGNKKIGLIHAFADTGINDDYVINKLIDMIYNTIPNSNFLPIEKDIISIQITQALAKSNRDDIYIKLINIASNSSFYRHTRVNALMYLNSREVHISNKEFIIQRLQQLSQDILSSTTYQEDWKKNLLNDEVIQILNKLRGV